MSMFDFFCKMSKWLKMYLIFRPSTLHTLPSGNFHVCCWVSCCCIGVGRHGDIEIWFERFQLKIIQVETSWKSDNHCLACSYMLSAHARTIPSEKPFMQNFVKFILYIPLPFYTPSAGASEVICYIAGSNMSASPTQMPLRQSCWCALGTSSPYVERCATFE